MSKIKFKSYKSFFQILILLSGDIALNPGPTYPCSICDRGVRSSSIYCHACNKWTHSRCEGLSRSEVIVLSRTSNLSFTCRICRDIQARSLSTANTPAPIEQRSTSSPPMTFLLLCLLLPYPQSHYL